MSLDQRLVDLGFHLKDKVLTGEQLTVAGMRGPDQNGLCHIRLRFGGEVQVKNVQRIDLRNIVIAGHRLLRLVQMRPLAEPPTLRREILHGALSVQGPEVRGCIPNATLEVDVNGIATIAVPKGGTITLGGFSRIVLEEPEVTQPMPAAPSTPSHS